MNSRLSDIEEHISDLENRVMETTQSEKQKEKQILKNENSLWDLWRNIKCTNIQIIGVPEGEEREKGIENVFKKIMAKDFPNRWKRKQMSTYRKHRGTQTV